MTARKQLSEAAVSALGEEWEAHGPAALETLRRHDPAAYLRMIARAGTYGDGEPEEDDAADLDLAALAALLAGM